MFQSSPTSFSAATRAILRSASIASILHGVRHFVTAAGHDFPSSGQPQLHMLLRGLQRLDPPPKSKDPVSLKLLLQCYRRLNQGSQADTMLSACPFSCFADTRSVQMVEFSSGSCCVIKTSSSSTRKIALHYNQTKPSPSSFLCAAPRRTRTARRRSDGLHDLAIHTCVQSLEQSA